MRIAATERVSLCVRRQKLTAFSWTELDAPLVRRLFIENCAESVFVVAKPPAMRFGEGSDLRFALSAIVGPNTGQVRFVWRASFAFFSSLAIRLASIFIAAGSKNVRF